MSYRIYKSTSYGNTNLPDRSDWPLPFGGVTALSVAANEDTMGAQE
jgi:hypothetical protein